MVPQAIGHNQERGYYIVWDTINWRKERVCLHVPSRPSAEARLEAESWLTVSQRELILHYSDLDTTPMAHLQHGNGA